MTTSAVMCDPELSAEDRALLVCSQRPRRVFATPAAKVRFERGAMIPPSEPLRIWEAIESGFWECKGCGGRAVQQEQPAQCDRCQEARAAFRWVWHEPVLAGRATREAGGAR